MIIDASNFNDECCICLEPLNNEIDISKNIIVLNCNHIIHEECKEKLLHSKCESREKCPICRTRFTKKEKKKKKNENTLPLPIVQAMLFSLPSMFSNNSNN